MFQTIVHRIILLILREDASVCSYVCVVCSSERVDNMVTNAIKTQKGKVWGM